MKASDHRALEAIGLLHKWSLDVSIGLVSCYADETAGLWGVLVYHNNDDGQPPRIFRPVCEPHAPFAEQLEKVLRMKQQSQAQGGVT